jgi:pimeloyl-ACP methyl ester carboxylesterase
MAIHPAVFVHGSGVIGGPTAWPLQQRIADRTAIFVTRPGYGPGEQPVPTDFDTEARIVVDAIGDGAHVVSQSFGVLAAMHAAALVPERVRSLTLIEPAAYSVARGDEGIERHIRAVDGAKARHDLSLDQWWIALVDALGGPSPVPPFSPEDMMLARRWRLQPSAWEAEVDPTVAARVPTTVITGDWSADYETIARVLVEHGARHRHIVGNGHAVPKHPDTTGVLEEIFAEHD